MTTTFRYPIIRKSLIIDNNLITGKILSKILTKEFNHHVTLILSSSKVLNILFQDHYDLVFMDIDMLELSGIETSIKIRNSTIIIEKNRGIPIFAYTTNKLKKDFLNAGIVNNGYISKLTSSDKVQTVIENFYKTKLNSLLSLLALRLIIDTFVQFAFLSFYIHII
ncbi:1808_t:CDS:2 [Gigaspora margarita]|uniref:1808_t:CDS:1 n=1 Tax=Gigaspora margarita TaxID=4874 RepID=A0ABN7V3G6_GIGMA|nr:1808_t:CDS:2 [Gigaspora margarita]